jgi:putative transposase
MARMARAVVAGVPHLVTQRGNRGQKTFLRKGDYETYKELVAEGCRDARVEVWAYCLMPKYVHLIVVPATVDGLRASLGEAHRRYTRHINQREGWQGFLWAGRFSSCPMDEEQLLAATRYVELAPVRGKLVKQAKAWPWSSARAHLARRDDDLVRVRPLLASARNWKEFLDQGVSREEMKRIGASERTGRPLGSPAFVARLEKRLGRTLAKQKPGPKPKKRRAVVAKPKRQKSARRKPTKRTRR